MWKYIKKYSSYYYFKRHLLALLFFFQVECRVRYPIKGSSPPVPEENQQPIRELFAGWCEYTYADDRTFFYNSKTGEKSWKPPRRRCNTDVCIPVG